MATAKITMVGLMNYCEANNINLWASLDLPAGMNDQDFINAVVLRGGEFEVLYPDPDYFAGAIGAWSQMRKHTFERWVKALAIDYEPLENYNRQESWSDNKSTQREENGTTVDNRTSSENGSNENKVSAFDSSSYQPKEQDTSSNASNSAGLSSSQSIGKGTEGSMHTGVVKGNIGTMTSQKMLTDELAVARFSLYEEAADLFCSDFLIYTY